MSQNCKYYKQKRQVSYDNGVTFVDVSPAEYRKGELIESASTDCNTSPTTDYSTQYLTFEAISAGTFSFSGTSYSTIDNSSVLYSLDSGSTWYTLNREVQSPTVQVGQKIMWKSSTFSTRWGKGIGRFSSTGNFNVEGNIMSLLYGDNFSGQTDLSEYNSSFRRLFSGCTGLISAENLVLPATTLSYECYESMFTGCTSLTTAPVLSATTLATSCYLGMFDSCTSLTTAPELPATNLSGGYNCYAGMFYGCTSLTTAPDLPATTLEETCYQQMFVGCTSLTTAPELPATILKPACYNWMFFECTNLSYVKCLATDISAENCTQNWLRNVSSSGTFVKNSSMSSWTSGVNGIPSNWTVQNA